MLTGIVKNPLPVKTIRENAEINTIKLLCDEIEQLRYALKIAAWSAEHDTRISIAEGAGAFVDD